MVLSLIISLCLAVPTAVEVQLPFVVAPFAVECGAAPPHLVSQAVSVYRHPITLPSCMPWVRLCAYLFMQNFLSGPVRHRLLWTICSFCLCLHRLRLWRFGLVGAPVQPLSVMIASLALESPLPALSQKRISYSRCGSAVYGYGFSEQAGYFHSRMWRHTPLTFSMTWPIIGLDKGLCWQT